MNVASRFDIAVCRVECATSRDLQLKCVDEQFSLELFRKAGAWIDYDLTGDGIHSILFKFSDACRDCR